MQHTVTLSIYDAVNALEKTNRRRYTDNEIATATGLHRQTIATLRKGKQEKTIAKLLDYFRAEGLEVGVADLFVVGE